MDKVTDEGLAALSKLPKLKILKLRDCSFSPQGNSPTSLLSVFFFFLSSFLVGIQTFMKERRDSLRRLDLHQFPCINDTVLVTMAKNAIQLEELNLSSLNITFYVSSSLSFPTPSHFLMTSPLAPHIISTTYTTNLTYQGFEHAAHFLPNLRKVSFLWCAWLTDPLPHEERVQWGQKVEYIHFDSCEKLRCVRVA